jgi:ABC-type amino acid transport substrate-binding protein
MILFALLRLLAAPAFARVLAAPLALLVCGGVAQAADAPLRVAVYDAPPYGHLEPDGSLDGVSVDLFRRAAESLGREYRLLPVAQMEDILKASSARTMTPPSGRSRSRLRGSRGSISAIRRIVQGPRL